MMLGEQGHNDIKYLILCLQNYAFNGMSEMEDKGNRRLPSE